MNGDRLRYVIERERAGGGWYEVAATDEEPFARHLFTVFAGSGLAQGRIIPLRLRDAEAGDVLAAIGGPSGDG